MWALSEAGLAGVLHAFRVPFTGMVIGSVAVLFISLIHIFESQKGTLLKAAVLVMIVKAAVSPHTPVNAYLAVGFQALTGALLFRMIKNTALAVFLLALFAMLEAALQKLLILTLVFGQTLWESINIFGHFVLRQLFLSNSAIDSLNFSLVLILVYTGIHIIAGIYTGLKTPKIAARLQNAIKEAAIKPMIKAESYLRENSKGKRNRWQKKITLFLLIAVSLTIFIGSYLFTFFEKSQGAAAIIMLVRSILIMLVWYFLISPLSMRLLHRYLKRKQNSYSLEIQNILFIFPLLKAIVRQSWTDSFSPHKSHRLSRFVEIVMVTILTIEFSEIPEKI